MNFVPLNPTVGMTIQNDAGDDIPPRSVVQVTSVTTEPATDTQESTIIAHVKQYAGVATAGPIMITSGFMIRDGQQGKGYFDQFIYATVDSVLTPVAGTEYGPVSGTWTIGTGGRGFIACGADGNTSVPTMSLFYRAPSTASPPGGSSSSNASAGCGCCDCFECISAGQAVVGGCLAAPNGAAFEYDVTANYPAYPEASGTFRLRYGIQTHDCGSSSSSTSSSSSSGGGCVWTSCLISITRSNPSSSSSSSPSTGTGLYQWREDMNVAPPTVTLAFVSGTDVVELGW